MWHLRIIIQSPAPTPDMHQKSFFKLLPIFTCRPKNLVSRGCWYRCTLHLTGDLFHTMHLSAWQTASIRKLCATHLNRGFWSLLPHDASFFVTGSFCKLHILESRKSFALWNDTSCYQAWCDCMLWNLHLWHLVPEHSSRNMIPLRPDIFMRGKVSWYALHLSCMVFCILSLISSDVI